MTRHGKSGKASASRFAFSAFFLDFSTSTARLLDTFSMSAGDYGDFLRERLKPSKVLPRALDI